ncbi:hypothetical protein [Rubricoccus marinus]|uniref:Phytanoyl-CoA dioxygenase n=1 Tax=Rubricoccus marinus TaxID=716817 RepID=A0A259TZ53_9BACT|nr:hypothetical protein [Rubricoccus marinus]OZC03032.1 hypothetical protein BSZ36_08650 [Rubricoccus marinus]
MTLPAPDLARIVRTVLDPTRDPVTLRPEVMEIVALFEAATEGQFVNQGGIAAGESLTPGGLALSPVNAAMCASHYVRTVVFLRGLYTAVQDARGEHPSRPARVFYAGCGPYATLAVPLMAVVPPEDAVFTLLDLHAASVESARRIVCSLGFEASVQAYQTGDILDVRFAEGERPDIIVTEVLQRALDREPQVAVTRHLLAQAPEARLVPAEIHVDLSAEVSAPDDVPRLGSAFVLSREAVASWDPAEADLLVGGFVTLSEPLPPEARLVLSTRIQTYGEHWIHPYQSSLTQPKAIPLRAPLATGSRLAFAYALGAAPGMVVRRLPPLRGLARLRQRFSDWVRPA